MLQRKACTCLGASEEERLECVQAPSIGLCTVTEAEYRASTP